MIDQRLDYYNLQLANDRFVIVIEDKYGGSSKLSGVTLRFDDYFAGDGWRKHLNDTGELEIHIVAKLV